MPTPFWLQVPQVPILRTNQNFKAAAFPYKIVLVTFWLLLLGLYYVKSRKRRKRRYRKQRIRNLLRIRRA